MNIVCQQKTLTPCRFETTQSYLLDQSPKIQYKRVNSPGLPDCSFRRSHKSSVDKRNYVTLGQVEIQQFNKHTQYIQESPEQRIKPFNEIDNQRCQHSFNPQQYRTLREDKEIQVEEKPYSSPPKMEILQKPKLKQQMMMVDKIESDKLSVEIFMSEQDENSLIFTGITKKKMMSPEENKQILMQNLQQLFTSIDNNTQNQNKFQNYIKLESLEQSVFHQHLNKSTQQDFLSISSAQSIKQKCSSQQNFRRNSAIIPKQPTKWNNSTKSQKSNCPTAKQSKSPFLKQSNNSINKPKLQQISTNIQSPQKKLTSKKQQQQQQPNRSTVQKVRSFHVSPDKIDDCIYDERYYK